MMLTCPVKRHRMPAVNGSLLEDLALKPLLSEHFIDPVSYLTCDAHAIAERSRALQWLMLHPAVLASMCALRDALNELHATARALDSDAVRVLGSLGILQKVYGALNNLNDYLSGLDVSPPQEIHALRQSLAQAKDLAYSENFQEAWSQYAQGLDHMGCLVYKVRMNRKAQISSIAIEGVHKHKAFKLNAPWYKALFQGEGKTFVLHADTSATPGRGFDPSRSLSSPAQLKIIFNRLLQTQASTLRAGIRAAALRVHQHFTTLNEEMDFFVRASSFLHAVKRSNLPYTFASMNSSMDDPVSIQGMHHPSLFSQTITRNDLRAARGRHVVLLGGYNRDGKTTFLRTVGAVQVLFQMGLPCPALSACLYPAASLVSVFAGAENTGLVYGKLGQELEKLRAALFLLTRDGCFFFNEPITGTSASENHHISKEILCILLAQGQRGIWVTHLYPLFDDVDAFQQLNLESDLVCMRTRQGDPDAPPFSVMDGKPNQDSGARLVC